MIFINNIYMYEGGMYEEGFKCVLMWVINDYVCKNNLLKESDVNLFGEDVCEGMMVVVSVKYLDF